MKIRVIEDAIEVCKKHLDATHSKDTQVGSFLAQYLLVLIYSKYEDAILDLIRRRASKAGDGHVTQFVDASSRRVFRSLKITELSGLLGKFGEDYKALFTKKTKNSRAKAAYDAILSSRQETAHGTGGQMTFEEVCNKYKQSTRVLDAFAHALGLNDAAD